MKRRELVSFVLSTAACYWLPGADEICCVSCFSKALIKPIRFWPITDEHLGMLCGLDQSFRFCDRCQKEIGVEETRQAS